MICLEMWVLPWGVVWGSETMNKHFMALVSPLLVQCGLMLKFPPRDLLRMFLMLQMDPRVSHVLLPAGIFYEGKVT